MDWIHDLCRDWTQNSIIHLEVRATEVYDTEVPGVNIWETGMGSHHGFI